MPLPKRISITTGDQDGIGLEITAKALSRLKPKKDVRFYFWRSKKCPLKYLRLIDSNFKRITVKTWPEALSTNWTSSRHIIDIQSSLPPARWVEQSAKASLYGHLDAIATAPLSKTQIIKSGINAIGHTEILKKVVKDQNLFMAFLGKHFNVLLVTDHKPIKDVSRLITKERLISAIQQANKVRALLPAKTARKPLAILGLNPHAGETGIIGKEEQLSFKEALTHARRARIQIDGPLVPDAAFLEKNWSKYSIFVCPYHDQGLIPFKMIHGQDDGVHITMGLPFIRTSVDHGTAKDIFGRNKANPNSMLQALEWAMKLTARK